MQTKNLECYIFESFNYKLWPTSHKDLVVNHKEKLFKKYNLHLKLYKLNLKDTIGHSLKRKKK
jgi:hypothetical protein